MEFKTSRKLIILSGLVLAVGIWLIYNKVSNDRETAEQAVPTPPTKVATSGLATSTSGRDTVGSLSARDRASEKYIDNPEAEIHRLLADDSISTTDASLGLLEVAANNRVGNTHRCEALQHALNLVPDENYAAMILKDPDGTYWDTPEMQSLLLLDAHNRQDIAKIPAALAVLKHADGEVRTEAKELLAFLLDLDETTMGDDYAQWHAAVTQRMNELAQSPE